MAWYRAGTIQVTNGSAGVVGTGTDFLTGLTAGEGLVAPDGKVYEVLSIASATSLTLGSLYTGTSLSGQAYAIAPTQSYLLTLATRVAVLLNTYATYATTTLLGLFGDGTVSAPSVAFSSDTNTGMRRVGTDNLALVTGGADRVSVSNTNLAVTNGHVQLGTLYSGAFTDDVGVYIAQTGAGSQGASSGGVSGLAMNSALTGQVNYSAYGAILANSFAKAGSGTHADFAQLSVIGQTITGSGATVTNASTLKILGPMAGATNNYSLWVTSGSARLDGNVGIGKTPAYTLDVAGTQVNLARGSTDTAPFYRSVSKYRGTIASPTTVVTGDFIHGDLMYGWDGTALRNAAAIYSQVDGVPATNTVPGKLTFATAPAGVSQTPVTRMTIDSPGNVGIGVTATSGFRLHVQDSTNCIVRAEGTGGYGAFAAYGSGTNSSFNFFFSAGVETGRITAQNTGVLTFAVGSTQIEGWRIAANGAALHSNTIGFGYGAGAGGAVTQITSRTTGVTLDKPSGAITLFTAAGSATAASLIVTNSKVAATDTINLSVKSGTNKYLAFVTAVNAGSFEITFFTTGGVVSDAPVINFAVIKAVAA